MPRQSIIIDCDPGQDDAIALLLALGSPDELELIGVTAVAGNVPLRLTAPNAQRILALAGRSDIPVWAGCDKPLVRVLETAEYVHGKTGMDGAVLPEPRVPLQPGHAVDALIDLVRARPPGTVTLVPTGPLTNVALAFRKAPDLPGRLKQIVLMGGAIGHGNVTPAAEFNLYVDPEAAQIVFTAGAPIVMFGLDVTHQALVTAERLAAIEALGTPVAKAACGLLDFFNRFDIERYATPGGPLHDPCPVAWLIDPTLFSGKDCLVEIETAGASAGRTNVHWWPREQKVPNAYVVDRIDADRFFALLTQRIGRLGAAA